MITLNIIYIIAFFIINIIQIKNSKEINRNILFDIISTNTLVFFKLIFYFLYKNINYTILFDFLLIFIIEVYKKDLLHKNIKYFLILMQLINLLNILLLFRYIV